MPRTTHQKQGQTCVEHLDSGRWSYLDFCNSNAQWLPMFSLFFFGDKISVNIVPLQYFTKHVPNHSTQPFLVCFELKATQLQAEKIKFEIDQKWSLSKSIFQKSSADQLSIEHFFHFLVIEKLV